MKRDHSIWLVICSALVLVAWSLSDMSCTPPADTADDDDSSEDDDDSADDDDDSSEDDLDKICESIEWTDKTHYLAKGSTVAKWKQDMFVDKNGNGEIDKDEEEDERVTFPDLCKTGKKSLVILMATDE